MALQAAASFFLGQAGSSGFGPLGEAIGQSANLLAPMKHPSYKEVFQAWSAGLIPTSQFIGCLRTEGYDITPEQINSMFFLKNETGSVDLQTNRTGLYRQVPQISLLQSLRWIPSITETNELWNRKLITEELAKHYYAMGGVLSPHEQEALAFTRFAIPSPSDLLSFAVREAFSPNIVEQFGYAKEFPLEIVPYMEQQGYGMKLPFDRPPSATDNRGRKMEGRATWSDLYWYAHWTLPSPSQAYEMYHRLYADSRYGPSPSVAKGDTFSRDDLETFLRVDDYPKYWRDKLIAISEPPLTRVDTRRMFDLGIIDSAQVYHSYRNQGYGDREAEQLRLYTVEEKKQRTVRKVGRRTEGFVCRMYSMGLYTEHQTLKFFVELGLSPSEAQNRIDLCSLELRYKSTLGQIKAIRKAFMEGFIDDAETNRALSALGINQDMIAHYWSQWGLERVTTYRPLSTKMILDQYKAEIISSREATTRLRNLRYTLVDIGNMLRHVDKVWDAVNDARLKREQKAQTIAAARADKAAKQTMREKVREQEQQLKRILSASTDRNLIKWWKAGLITTDEIRSRLRVARGWSTADIDKWVATNTPDEEDILNGTP